MSENHRIIGWIFFTGSILCCHSRKHLGFSLFPRKAYDDKGLERLEFSPVIKYGNLILNQSSNYDINKEAWRNCRSINEDDSKECEIEVTNDFEEPVLFCWIDTIGDIKYFYPINDGSIKDGSVKNSYVEFCMTGHTFVCLRQTDNKLPKTLSDCPPSSFLFTYQPTLPSVRHKLRIFKTDTENQMKLDNSIIGNNCKVELCVRAMESVDVIDNRDKIYETVRICGFSLQCEPKVFESTPTLLDTISTDLQMIQHLLPKGAYEKLRESTPIWLNKSITFGPKANPIVGNTSTYHPMGGTVWLEKMGLDTRREGCIEIYDAEEYLASRGLWGPGGVLMHEYSHAFHDKCCPDGYDCLAIQEAYQRAMSRSLYERVAVHGPQADRSPDRKAKAYACTNCMEFFAELSVAYMWRDDDELEYNKWFPFNQHQLKQYDVETFQLLDRCWKVFEAGADGISDTPSI